MKKCPFCAEEIQDEAIVCRYCGRDLPARSEPRPDQGPTYTIEAHGQRFQCSLETLKKWIREKRVLPLTLAWKPGMPQFRAARFFPELAGTLREVKGVSGWPVVGALALATASAISGWKLGFIVAALIVVAGVAVEAALFVKHWGGAKLRVAAAMTILGFGLAAMGTYGSWATRHAAMATLPGRLAKLDADVGKGLWKQAKAEYDDASAIDPDYPGLQEAITRIKPALAKLERIEQEQLRHDTVVAGLKEAEQVVRDAHLCDTPKKIAEAWKKLRQVHSSDAEYDKAKRVTLGLERCRRKAERELSRGVLQTMIDQRRGFQTTLENNYLGRGINATVRVHGPNADRITISYALMNKALAYQMTQGGSIAKGSFLRRLEDLGFSQVTLTDGYDFSTVYTLDPPDERNKGGEALARFGLAWPLTLK